jgi:hypothetical protein
MATIKANQGELSKLDKNVPFFVVDDVVGTRTITHIQM